MKKNYTFKQVFLSFILRKWFVVMFIGIVISLLGYNAQSGLSKKNLDFTKAQTDDSSTKIVGVRIETKRLAFLGGRRVPYEDRIACARDPGGNLLVNIDVRMIKQYVVAGDKDGGGLCSQGG